MAIFFLLAHFWAAQKGSSIRIIDFAGSFLDCANGKGHKNGSFFFLTHFWTAQQGRSI